MEHTKVNLISVIVRSHDPKKEWILLNAIESLLKQTYKNLELVLVLQNYNEEELKALNFTLKELLGLVGISYQVELLRGEGDEDLRSRALNRGLALCKGSRVAFLDYDDVFYPNALERLSKTMDQSQAGCVVGAVDFAFVEYDTSKKQVTTLDKQRFFSDAPSLERLKHNSFIPIHSFLVDKKKMEGLLFSEDMQLFEDYTFLLELSTRVNFNFSLFSEEALCEYRVEQVGGASILGLAQRNPKLYKEQKEKIWALRKRLGFLTPKYYLEHLFYYPLKTKLARLLKIT